MKQARRSPTSLSRVVSGLAAGGFGLVVVGLGGWWFALAVGVIVHLALLEFFRLAQFKGIRPATKTTLVVCQLLLIATQWGSGGGMAADLAAAVVPVSGAAICAWLLLQPVTGTIADIAASIFGLFYLGFLPSHWLRLRDLSDGLLAPRLAELGGPASSGMALTLLACLLVVATDIGSYVIGRRLGRHPLSPISPGKTIEGAIGGLAWSVLVGGVGGVLLGWPWGWAIGGLLGALVSVFALVGDLTESMMKRDAGVKDSGDAIPGHGGILDRIDSYLFTPAVVFYFVTLVLPLVS
ncbi:phosphatidate cytidylyltransferase [Synechococcus sp. CS-602]|uniref:phosphatidate cytidylyltransferase n=1 Tax=Synechococcaceae TaxID=1890426 RepID=UPI000AAA106A|nr:MULTISPECIES: phosphatidate cytidylyltransferase [Synechococcaceae]MCT4363684.1 phosphatidate cytidylyltransferase [Candidatus Regnicoccus frigidus MAG-AL1]MCT0202754.1 phosphatidate cytidylyltransferase [Synechococcus sp. CS-603]MCT0203667.1 phosphatidate cytidylyltransferase [Synechococcus sp. CS-602]MCT0245336.1 phosphatidate cytidylyltransferase [Synechococcus sp. CS-601]MCT4366848.1 phosphatidate cytidylyltransferase [Candidatus Regnicoccus frigidus MAG-AL2]